MTQPRLVLASRSPRRADVMRQLGLEFRVRVPDVAEDRRGAETAAQYVERLARDKALAVAPQEPGALVVAGDTIVVDGERILGKPRSETDAVEMLVSLSGRHHHVLSGLAVAGPHGIVSEVARAVVSFREVDEARARAYVATGEPLDKAGAYGIQGVGAALVERVEGDYYCVVGFPVTTFLELLSRAGWRYEFDRLTPNE